ncbi:hypothetical protein G8J22_00629 [Lentilactobacillus hilgardii]|nr:hypothetical protein HMPREF0497_0928 [Lentilactobacillus buchneri ATCC 11577]QIR08695.1 hypothetical protein G8J22_00629 [Lentilactobacillus hilgardii]
MDNFTFRFSISFTKKRSSQKSAVLIRWYTAILINTIWIKGYQESSSGTLETGTGQSLNVSGNAHLNGKLIVDGRQQPANKQVIFKATKIQGKFKHVQLKGLAKGWHLSYDQHKVVLVKKRLYFGTKVKLITKNSIEIKVSTHVLTTTWFEAFVSLRSLFAKYRLFTINQQAKTRLDDDNDQHHHNDGPPAGDGTVYQS